MLVSILGFNLPGRRFCRPDGSLMNNVHVGLQVGKEPAELVKADATEARWDFEIEAVFETGSMTFVDRQSTASAVIGSCISRGER